MTTSTVGWLEFSAMKVLELGHVNLWVTDLDRSSAFYRDVLGLSQVAGGVLKERRVAFFSLGTRHHDLALVEVGRSTGAEPPMRRGLDHIGFKVGNHLDDLRRMREWLIGHDTPPRHYVDHRVCQSLHVDDPDGNDIELYVDGDPEIWGRTPEAIVCSNPFLLE
jgi:catechol 2,3-dioxygenase